MDRTKKFSKLVYMVYIYVNKKELTLVFCVNYCVMDLTGKKHLNGLFCMLSVLHMSQRVHKLSQAFYWEAGLSTLVFMMVYGTYCCVFRFADLIFLSFSEGKIRTPEKLDTPQRF